ncbi:hypothetical protein AAV99_10110 [Aurantiacibacter marinus]|uniref:Uncharacterized protein n=1 Tax=Aurantiacibacter marinus TaxID=874156 RepID=A0A0H0XMX9_9SPHN|nr:hypothetical protein AAV99_10110 [Aurantiacibacter marinus]
MTATVPLAAGALATGTLATGPEDLLPPAFRNPPPQPRSTPSPAPAPAPTPTASAARPATPSAPAAGSTSTPVVQSVPSTGSSTSGSSSESSGDSPLPSSFPSLRELESMEADEINEVLGLRPKFDIPAAARRSAAEVGVISEAEGGFAAGSLAGQPARLVLAALRASDGPVVSRWGHILLRRVLASRLDTPRGLDPVDFAALRARALNGMGEAVVARALVQDVDGGNYNNALTNAAFNSYVASADLLGMCPVARLQPSQRDDGEWELMLAICSAYLGEARGADRRLGRALGNGIAPEIDVRLAQRFAGAAGEGGRAVNIEWDGVEELTPWRFALSRALGVEIPAGLRSSGSAMLDYSEVLIPASPLLDRVAASDRAGGQGLMSSAAMVDLYAQFWASDEYSQEDKIAAGLLRQAYAARTVTARVAAMRELWEGDETFGRHVLTAYAAARLPVRQDLVEDAAPLIASMLSAGLDRSAMRWGSVVSEGTEGWALLAIAQPERSGPVSSGAVSDFISDDLSEGQRKSAFLVAGLAGLGRLEADDFADLADDLGVNYSRSSAWSDKIGRAAQVDNQALVALLAGVGMQGTSWDQMTPRQLYHIVSALTRVGLSAEARMIAAEAVSRG